MTKEDLKKLIQEVYKEVASEPKAEKAKAEKPKSAPAAEKPAVKKVAKVVKAVAPKRKIQIRLPSHLSRQLTNTVIRTNLLVTKVMLICLVKSRKYLLHMLAEDWKNLILIK